MTIKSADWIETLSPTMKVMIEAYHDEVVAYTEAHYTETRSFQDWFREKVNGAVDIESSKRVAKIRGNYEQRIKCLTTRVNNLERELKAKAAAKKGAEA